VHYQHYVSHSGYQIGEGVIAMMQGPLIVRLGFGWVKGLVGRAEIA